MGLGEIITHRTYTALGKVKSTSLESIRRAWIFKLSTEQQINLYIDKFSNLARTHGKILPNVKEAWDSCGWRIAMQMRNGLTFEQSALEIAQDHYRTQDILAQPVKNRARTDSWQQPIRSPYNKGKSKSKGKGKGKRQSWNYWHQNLGKGYNQSFQHNQWTPQQPPPLTSQVPPTIAVTNPTPAPPHPGPPRQRALPEQRREAQRQEVAIETARIGRCS